MSKHGKRRVRRITRKLFPIAATLICAVILIYAGFVYYIKTTPSFTYTDLGVPYADIYGEEQLLSRLSDDMIVFDGKLYVGGGDYDANTGPVYVTSYDTELGQWKISDEPLEDEQIKRFRILDGKLTTLGTDPKGSWETGCYYVLNDGTWETLSVLTYGIHCYDAVEFEGKTFFGLGVSSGHYPAAVLENGEYSSVEFYREGALLDTSHLEIIRVYNLFEFDSKLYAFLTFEKKDAQGDVVQHIMDLYVYNGESFEFFCGTLLSEDMPEVVTDGNQAYLILNDTLLVTENLINYSAVTLDKGSKAVDIIKHDGEIFVLTWRELEPALYDIAVFKKKDGKFLKRFDFEARATAGSFCKDGDTVYVSLGQRETPDDPKHVGRVYEVNLRYQFLENYKKYESILYRP